MKAVYPLLILGLIALTLVTYLFNDYSSQQLDLALLESVSTVEGVELWQERIAAVGGTQAYQEFSNIFNELPYSVQHRQAHTFGEALYKVEGTDGIVVCDSNFGFGCYHSFFGWALNTEGVEIVTDLDEACIAAYGEKGLGCQHGIGHGVLVELGYDQYQDSLELCKTLDWQEPIGGCTSGVFMEYNFKTMAEGDVRPVGDTGYHYPCDKVAEKFTEACYFEQPQWWYQVTAGDYERIGELCAEAPTDKEQIACYRGVGNLAASYEEYKIELMLQACSLMPTESSRLLCIEGATWLMSAQPEFKDTWQRMCDELEGMAKKQCLDSINLI